MLSTLVEGTVEYTNAVKERQHLIDLLFDAQYENSRSYIEEKDVYGRERGLSEKLSEQLRILNDRTKKDSKQYKQAAKEIYSIQKEIYEADKTYKSDSEKIWKEYDEKRIEMEEEKAAKIKEINEKLQSDIKAADKKYSDAVNSRTKSLYSAYGLFDEVKKKETVNSSSLMKNLQDQVDEFEDWKKTLDSLSARGLNESLIEELQEMGPSAIAEIKALSSMSDSQLQQYATLWSTKHRLAKDKAIEELEDLRIETDTEIKRLKKTAEKDLNEYNESWNTKMYELKNSTTQSLIDLRTEFSKNVGLIKTDTIAQMNEMVQTVNSIMRQAGFDELGNALPEGVMEGVKQEGKTLFSFMTDFFLGRVIKPAKRTVKINSPSKVFAGIGEDLIAGLVIGIKGTGVNASDAVSSVGDSMIETMSSSISRISDVINSDVDVEPTITPVLDLTNVRNGIGMIDGAFRANRSMNLGMAIAANDQNGNSYQSELFGKMQNMTEKTNMKLTSAIDSLRSDFSKMASKLESMQVVLDSGTLVGEIAPDMDNALGRLARMNRRGVR